MKMIFALFISIQVMLFHAGIADAEVLSRRYNDNDEYTTGEKVAIGGGAIAVGGAGAVLCRWGAHTGPVGTIACAAGGALLGGWLTKSYIDSLSNQDQNQLNRCTEYQFGPWQGRTRTFRGDKTEFRCRQVRQGVHVETGLECRMISVQITGHHTFRFWKNGTSTETAVFCNDGNGGWVKTRRSALRSADYIPPDRQILPPPPRVQYQPAPLPAPRMAPVVMNFDTSGIRDANATPVHHRRQLDLWAEYIATQRSQGVEIRISRQNLDEIKQYANPQEVDRVFRGVVAD